MDQKIYLQKFKDCPQVKVVDGNLDKALHIFKKLVDQNGILKELKTRSEHPSRAGRKKLKLRKSKARLKKMKG